jgi:hypothetical protein
VLARISFLNIIDANDAARYSKNLRPVQASQPQETKPFLTGGVG